MSLKDREEGFMTPGGIVTVLGLLLSILLVAAVYSLIIRPQVADLNLADKYGLENPANEGSGMLVIIKDYEQQACFTLMLWVLMILAYKYSLVRGEAKLINREERRMDRNEQALLPLPSEGHLYHDEADATLQKLERNLEQDASTSHKLLPYLLERGLLRFEHSGSIQEATDVVTGRINLTADRLESELSIIRYVAWAIPSIGFIGTVRGIGAALADADQALEGDISGVTASLGLAFNSTLVALCISIFLMFFIHSLQSRQEGTILHLENFVREQFLDRLRPGSRPPVPLQSEASYVESDEEEEAVEE